jgi:hypothetical protein
MEVGLMGSGVPDSLFGDAESLSSSSHGVCAGGAAEDNTGVALSFEGTLVVGALIGDAVTVVEMVTVEQGVVVGMISVEQGVENTGPPEMSGTPGCCVKAGALLGLKDSEAGTWMDELYGSGWSSSTGVGVGVTVDTRELGGSIVAPGVTRAKLGRAESAGNLIDSDRP